MNTYFNRTHPPYAERHADPLKVVALSDDEAEVYLYDVIDPYWGCSADEMIDKLGSISASRIHLRINSPGGEVFEARAMHTALRQHDAEVIAHIDGLAASAATVVMLAADNIVAAPGSMIMIHKVWSFVWGNSDELRHTADVLDKIDETLLNDYRQKTGQSREQLMDWLEAETWFTAKEALAEGFVDELSEPADDDDESAAAAAAMVREFQLCGSFKNVPKWAAVGQKVAKPDASALESEQRRQRARLAEAVSR